ncbi:MAG: hypothetical protein R6U27_01525 [Desulfobacterales bacterium]
MIAYFVHDEKNKQDVIVLPDTGCSVSVTPEWFERFISVEPEFSKWKGETCGDLTPGDFGTVVASRPEKGDVCILHDAIWRERMFFYMTGARE